jgi:hypothetical protein
MDMFYLFFINYLQIYYTSLIVSFWKESVFTLLIQNPERKEIKLMKWILDIGADCLPVPG